MGRKRSLEVCPFFDTLATPHGGSVKVDALFTLYSLLHVDIKSSGDYTLIKACLLLYLYMLIFVKR